MSRYLAPPEDETAAEPGSRGRVLRNLQGITRKREMERAEFDALLIAQEAFLLIVTNETRFTAALLCEMHRRWLGGLYAWAGRYRTVELSKGGFTWPPAFRVAANMDYLERGLLAKHTPCPPGSVPEVARRMAEVHAELLLVHPFREGNGRLSRWLADLMAAQAGQALPAYPFEGRGSKMQSARYLQAVIRGYQNDFGPLTDFFVEALRRGAEDDSNRGNPRAPSNTDD